jgi:hypothetical protein
MELSRDGVGVAERNEAAANCLQVTRGGCESTEPKTARLKTVAALAVLSQLEMEKALVR